MKSPPHPDPLLQIENCCSVQHGDQNSTNQPTTEREAFFFVTFWVMFGFDHEQVCTQAPPNQSEREAEAKVEGALLWDLVVGGHCENLVNLALAKPHTPLG